MKVDVTRVFKENYLAYKNPQCRVISNQGSTRSSKTYSILQLLIFICINEKKFVSIVSCTLPHLKKGARRDFLEILKNLNLYNDNDFNKTDNYYKFTNGSIIEFFSVDNAEKLRGSKRDILFINEANLLNLEEYRQLAIRTTEKIFIDFNPADDNNYVYDISILPDTIFIKSTYKDNLKNLGPAQIKEIESMNPEVNKITGDLNQWRVYGLGERGTSGLSIYTHYRLYKEIPKNEYIKDVIYGLDFGVNDPTALIKISITEYGFYCEQLIYKGMTNPDIIKSIKSLKIDKNSYIFADTNNLSAILEIQEAGFNCIKAKKDVLLGIGEVKNTPILIKEDSLELIKDFQNYKWKEKNGLPIDEPAHLFSHGCDAVRYAVYTYKKLGDGIIRTNNYKLKDYANSKSFF
jgi:phage terminase large subunit